MRVVNVICNRWRLTRVDPSFLYFFHNLDPFIFDDNFGWLSAPVNILI